VADIPTDCDLTSTARLKWREKRIIQKREGENSGALIARFIQAAKLRNKPWGEAGDNGCLSEIT
jgi:hypothetical protein